MSTDPSLTPADRFSFWRDVVAEMTMPIRVSTNHVDDFRASVASASLGAIEVLNMQHKSINLDRPRLLIRRSDPEVYHFVLNLAGNQRLSQERTDLILRPGDMTLYSSSRTLRTLAEPGLDTEDAVVVVIPHSVLALPERRVQELLAMRIEREDPLAALVSAHLRSLAANARNFHPSDASRLSAITVDLISMLLARRLSVDEQVGSEGYNRVLLARIQAFVDLHLGDPRLTPETIAAAQHISLRTLQRLFRSQELTVASWIRDRRLDRCRRDLADPLLRGLSIQAIAARWAFPHGAHFSRAFKDAYGINPHAFRNRAGQA